MTLPTAPTDVERDGYFARYLGRLTLLSIPGMAGIGYSAVRFGLAHPHFAPYLAVIGVAVAGVLVSLRVNAFTRDDSLAEHRARVEGWCPAGTTSVDVFLPICGEPLAMLRNTWEHVAALAWHDELTVYVLDDGHEPDVEAMADEFGFTYLARPDRGWMKKAGNLRHGYEHSSGDFIAIFDADFCSRPDYLYELLPYFDDPSLGIVQSPQHFRVTPEQGWLKRGAGAVQEFFYRAVQVSRQRHDGAICVGTNAIYRRRALDSNGGTTLIGHSEDVHTGFDLRRHGWGLRYVPTCVATGACPDDLGAFFRQQYRWCSGSMSLLGSRKFWATRLPVMARLCYMSGFGYYLVTALMVIAAPVVPLALLLAAPELVRIENYAVLAPGLLYAYVVFPMWHRCRYGTEAFTVKMIYGWAHLFAIVDVLRRRPMGWTPTGAKAKTDRRLDVFRAAVVVWGCFLGGVWVGAAALVAFDRPVDLAPMLALGLLYLSVSGRTFRPTSAKTPTSAPEPQPVPALAMAEA
jgi:cellulose synthase/poly-beta-1,6-N-acetylglucosamine synthase-like glycosyltransferase